MFGQVVSDVVGATCQLIVVAGAGVYLARIKQLDTSKLSYLSKLIEQLLTPCLIFSSFVKTLDLTQLEEWVLPMFVSLLNAIQGMALGYFLNKYILKDSQYQAVIVLACGLCMTTNMQLNLSASLTSNLNEISAISDFESENKPSDRAIKYIMICTFVHTILRWTLAKEIMVKLGNSHAQEQHNDDENQQKKFDQQVELVNLQEKLANNEQQLSTVLLPTPPPTPVERNNKYISNPPPTQHESGWKSILNNHPIQAAIFSVVVCATPGLRELLLVKDSFLNRSIIQTTASIGNIILPLNLITLGGNLYLCTKQKGNTDGKNITMKALIGVTAARLLIMPFIGEITMQILMSLGLCTDPVLHFIMTMNNAVPSAINLLIIATLYSPRSAMEVSKVLLAGYSANILTLPVVLLAFFAKFT